jgi:hypothetical protein
MLLGNRARGTCQSESHGESDAHSSQGRFFATLLGKLFVCQVEEANFRENWAFLILPIIRWLALAPRGLLRGDEDCPISGRALSPCVARARLHQQGLADSRETSFLGFAAASIIFMRIAPEKTGDGKHKPRSYPAGNELSSPSQQ